MSRFFVFFALFINLLSAPAAAQESNPGAASQVVAPQTLPAGERAKFLYKNAERLFKDHKYSAAAAMFFEAHNLDPSPILVYNIARCYEEMGEGGKAAHYFGIYLARQGDNAPDANEVREKIVRLKAVAPKPPPDQQVMLASNGGGVPGPAEEPDTSKMAAARDQGILYFKKDRFKPAFDKFEEAQGLPGGAKDPVLQLYRAKTAWELGDVERAFGLVDLAVETAMGKKEEADVLEFSKEIEKLFTLVIFVPVAGEPLTKARLISDTGLIHKEKKTQFEKAQGRLETGFSSPITLALPPGEYKVNGQPFVVEGKRITVQVPKAPEVKTVDPPPPPATQPMPAPVAERSYLPPWEAWTAFGVAVVATGAATYFGLEATSMAEETVTERDYPQAKAAFEDRRLAANIAWGVAGAAAITGGVLWWLDATADPTPGTQGDVRFTPTPGGVLMDLSF